MNAGDWTALGTLGALLIPGLFLAALGALLLWIGFRWGRSSPSRGLIAIERFLRSALEGREAALPELRADDPASGLVPLARETLQALNAHRAPLDERRLLGGELLDLLPGRGVLLCDRGGEIQHCSDPLARLLGLRAEDLQGKPLASIVAADGWAPLAAYLADGDARRRGFSLLLRLRGTGSEPVEVTAHVSEPGGRLGVMLWIEPAPKIDQAAAERTRALERYRTVFVDSGEAVLLLTDGVVIEANDAANAWWGAAIVGTRLRELVEPEQMLRLTDRALRAQLGELPAAMPCRLVPLDPRLIPREVEAHFRPLGEGVAALQLRDLTPLRQPQEQLRLSRARLAAVLDAATDAMALLTPASGESDGSARVTLSLANRRFAEWIGLDRAALGGLAERDAIALAAARAVEPSALAAFLAGASATPEREHRGRFDLAGTPVRSVEIVFAPVLASAGEPTGRLWLVRDVTAQRETERRLHADAAALSRSRETLQRSYEELAAVHRDLEKKSTELDRLNRELVELDRARAQLMSEVTHELQTPLVSIRGYTQMILEGRLGKINDEQRRGLEVALRNVDRMVELIQNLLALARSEGQQPLRAEAVELDSVIDAVFQRVEGQARRKNIELLRRVTTSSRALAERDGLMLVIENLVSNGIKFGRSAGRVVVSAGNGERNYLTIEVEDNGVGIPADERIRVFERFYRGRGSANVPGSGIGLATVKNVVERHGGRIEVLDAPGGGTLVRVAWPKADVPVVS